MKKPLQIVSLLALMVSFALVVLAGGHDDSGHDHMSQQPAPGFPTTLITPDPEAGFALAIKLSRLGVKSVQPDTEVLKRLRPAYAENADSLIATSQVVAIHFQTIAAANEWWRERESQGDR